jgi:hypothetical protein
MMYSQEVEKMCSVTKGADHGPARIRRKASGPR